MKFKIKRILAVMLVFCMMMGMLPNALTAYAATPSDTIHSMTINGTPYYHEALDTTMNPSNASAWTWEGNNLTLRSYNGSDIVFQAKSGDVDYAVNVYVEGNCTINGNLETNVLMTPEMDDVTRAQLHIHLAHGASLTVTGQIKGYEVRISGPSTDPAEGAKGIIDVKGGIDCWYNPSITGYTPVKIAGDVKALIGNGSNEYGIEGRSVTVESPAYVLIRGTTYALEDQSWINVNADDYTVTKSATSVEAMPKVSIKDLKEIEVTSQPSKTEYFIGDDFEPAGMVVTAYYDDGSSKVLSSSDYTLQRHIDMPKGEGSNSLHAVRIVYEEDGITEDAWVQVKIEKSAGTLESISITKNPDRMYYAAGEDFDPAGMVVTATYSDGTTATVTGYTLQNDKDMPLGGVNNNHQVLVQYTENGTTQSEWLLVKVREYARYLESVEITKAPDKTAYEEGESFDPAGMEVTAHYDDGTSRVLSSSEYEIDVMDPLGIVADKAYVIYSENGIEESVGQEITVTAGGSVTPPETSDKVLTGIQITKNPDRMYYAEGEDFDPTGMEVTASYEDGTTADVTGKVTFQNDKDMPLGGVNNNHQVLVQYTENGTTQSKWLLVKVREYARYLESVEITKAPDKTAYAAGESFDPAGMEVTAHYDDGTSRVLSSSEYEIDVMDPLGIVADEAYVIYSENGIEESVGQEITVTAGGVAVTEYTISAARNELNYGQVKINDEAAGQTVSGKYEKGETVTLTAFPYSDYIFVEWLEDGEFYSSENPIEVEVNKDRNFTAVFEAKEYGINVTPESIEFSATEGYSANGLTKTITITNTSNAPFTDKVSVGLSGTDKANFTLDKGDYNNDIKPGESITVTVTPNEGLEVGEYHATLYVLNQTEIGYPMEVPITFEVKEASSMANSTVSGTVTSYLSATDTITIQLIEEGTSEAAYEATVTGNSATYTINDVVAGTYTLKVMKANHVTREYEVVVGTEAVEKDVKICPKGDVNLDGEVNADDLTALARHVAKIETLGDPYALLCSDVDDNGSQSADDLTKLARYVAKIINTLD